MRRKHKRVEALVLCAVVVVACSCGACALGQEKGVPGKRLAKWDEPPVITVSGHGEVHARPNKATISLGVETQADTAAKAQDGGNATLQKVITQIKQLKVPNQAIQTLELNLSPIYAAAKPGRESEPPRVVGYRSSSAIQIEVDDLALVGPVIDAAMSAGANRLEGVSFERQDELQYRTEALQLAAEHAQSKAQALAKVLNLKLTTVRRVSEGPANTLRPPYPLVQRAFSAVASTPVEPGELKVEASVTLEYEFQSAAPR